MANRLVKTTGQREKGTLAGIAKNRKGGGTDDTWGIRGRMD